MPYDGHTFLPGESPPPVAPPDRDRRQPRRQPYLVPYISADNRYVETTIWNGMYTHRYTLMEMFDFDFVSVTRKDDPGFIEELRKNDFPMVRRALTASDTYWEWIRLYHQAGKVYPHILWGGTVCPIPGGDGGVGFRAWKLHALTLR